jgi:hypothetical protein
MENAILLSLKNSEISVGGEAVSDFIEGFSDKRMQSSLSVRCWPEADTEKPRLPGRR